MKQIFPGIHTWSVFNQEKGLEFNGHLVVNDEGCALIDPPPMSDEDASQAEELGPPSVIIITNCHHTRGAMAFASRWHAPILLNEKDAGALPPTVRLGGIYRDGDRLAAGLLVVGLEDQNSPGESALLCGKAGAIIMGDALIGKPPGSFSLLPAEKYKDVAAARRGLRKLLEHSFDAVLLGDGTSLIRDGRRAVEAFLARE